MRRIATKMAAFLFAVLAGSSSVVGQSDVEDQRVAQEGRDGTSGGGGRWAVVIGVNEYSDPGIPWLKYCVEDARLLERTLEEHCGFQDHVLILASNQPGGPQSRPTAKNIIKQTSDWLKQAKSEDTVVVFFSGHGFLDSDGQIYLASEDCDRADLKNYGVPTTRLREALLQCEARKKLLLLDCCHAGAGDKGRIVNLERPRDVSSSELVGEVFRSAKGLITIASCQKDEFSYEWGAKQHGLFTYYLAEGLTGKADGDRDGIVDSSELFKYTVQKVMFTSMHDLNAKQTPVEYDEKVSNPFGLTWLPGGPTPAVRKVQARLAEPRGRVVGKFIQCSGSVSNWDPTLHLWLAVEVGPHLWFKDSEITVDAKTNTWLKEIDEGGTSPYISLGLYAADEAAHRDISAWVEKGKRGQSYERISFVKGTARVDHVDNLRTVNQVKAQFTEPKGATVGKTIRCSGSIENWDPTLHLWLAVEEGGRLWFKDSEIKVDATTNSWSKDIEEAGASPYISLGLYAADEAAHRDISAWVEKGKRDKYYETVTFVNGTACVARLEKLQNETVSAPQSPQ